MWNRALACALGLLLAPACSQRAPLSPTTTYKGPPRPPAEVAGVAAEGSIRITRCDGQKIRKNLSWYGRRTTPATNPEYWASSVELLPGTHTITVQHMYTSRIGLMGTGEYSEPIALTFQAQAGERYYVKMDFACRERGFWDKALEGALDAIPGVDTNVGTASAWLVEGGTNTVVAGTVPPGVNPLTFRTPYRLCPDRR